MIKRIPGGQALISMLHCAIFPSACKVCDRFLVFDNETLICRECRERVNAVHRPDAPVCRRCGRLMGNGYDICGMCTLYPPPYVRLLSYGRYRGVFRELILLYKYGGIERLKYLLADCFLRVFRGYPGEPFDYIIPVPPDRSRQREFDPIGEVTAIAARKLGIRLMTGNLVKIKETPPQAGLSKDARLKNLEQAFCLKSPAQLHNKRLLLVDDVYTTGTTLKTCTKLMSAQTPQISALTLARSY